MAKPSENTPSEVTKTPAPTIEKMEKPGELKEQEKQEEFKELTPEEQKQLKQWEEIEKHEKSKKLTPEEINWGEQEKPAK